MFALRRFLPKNVTVAKNFSIALTSPPTHADDAPSKKDLISHESHEDHDAHHEQVSDPDLQERKANKSDKDTKKAAEIAPEKITEDQHASYRRSL